MSKPFCDDEEQIIIAAKTDPEKFGELYRRYHPRIFRYVFYRVSNAQVADDLTSRSFERAISKLHTYQPDRGTFDVWLFAIAANVIRNHLRASRLRRWVSLDIFTDHPSGHPQPDEIVCHDEQIQELMLLVAMLKERERNLLALKFGAGLNNRRIAELCSLTESNVAVILFRTIRHLREQIVNQEMINYE